MNSTNGGIKIKTRFNITHVILDTSVIIAVLLSRRKTYGKDIIRLASRNKIKLVTCKEILYVLKTSISSEHIKKSSGYRNHLIGPFIAWYQHNAMNYSITNVDMPETSRDLKDNVFLQLAHVSQADYLITADKDLLVLKKIGMTSLVTPEKFIKRYKDST